MCRPNILYLLLMLVFKFQYGMNSKILFKNSSNCSIRLPSPMLNTVRTGALYIVRWFGLTLTLIGSSTLALNVIRFFCRVGIVRFRHARTPCTYTHLHLQTYYIHTHTHTHIYTHTRTYTRTHTRAHTHTHTHTFTPMHTAPNCIVVISHLYRPM